MRTDYSELFLHDTDKMALDALKAIPGFTTLLKEFMKVWNEKQFKILNLSTKMRLNENQLPKYYNMLKPICKKLGIDVPELYLELNVEPNAYTYGDTEPFIVITSGLLETIPEELIPTVLAHECGHIACHHTLYTTMANLILNGMINALNIGGLLTLPIQMAFSYWMRCSEFSADRAAIVCDGTGEKTVELCARLAGFDKDIVGNLNIEEFINQAKEYKEFIKDSKINQTLETFLLINVDHPLSAVRAYEAREWAKKEDFDKIVTYFNYMSEEKYETDFDVPIIKKSSGYYGKNPEDVKTELTLQGYKNIIISRVTDTDNNVKPDTVCGIKDENGNDLSLGWYNNNKTINILYYQPLSEQEIFANNPGKARVPENPKKLCGKNYIEVVQMFENSHFKNVVYDKLEVKKGLFTTEGSVAKITVNGQSQFDKGEWFDDTVEVRIVYNTIIK